MLVVVAIIVALIAILLPSLSKAVEAANRAVCLSNLHQQHIAFMSFGAEHRGALPRDGHGKWGNGIGAGALMMVPAVFDQGPFGRYAAQGILMDRGYLPRGGEVLICPSFSYPHMQLSTHTGGLGVGYEAGLTNGGGWWPDEADIPSGQHWLKAAYHYRNFAFEATGSWAPLSIRNSGSEPFIADHFSFIPADISRYQHGGQDYMTVTLGGAAYGVHDEDYDIRDQKGGATYQTGVDYHITETVWDTYFKSAG